jgi:hypothetical protein
LIRRAILADTHGNPVASPIIESVQLRAYRKIERFNSYAASDEPQVFLEWDLSRQLAFGGGGFRRCEPGDNQSSQLFSKGFDPFESGWDYKPKIKPAEMDCSICHSDPGIYSILSRSRKFEGPYPAALHAVATRESSAKSEWKAEAMPLWVLLRWLAAGE